MTTQQVLDALIAAIHAIAPHARFYTESIPQGFTRPCFFMDIRQKDFPLMDRRFRREFSVTIQFFPEKGNAMREKAQEMADQLTLFLEWVEVEGLPRRFFGSKSQIENDGTLKFECKYKNDLIKCVPIDKMQTLKKNISTQI